MLNQHSAIYFAFIVFYAKQTFGVWAGRALSTPTGSGTKKWHENLGEKARRADFWSRNQFPLSKLVIFAAQFPQSAMSGFWGANRPQHCTHSTSNPSLQFLHSPSSSFSPSSRFHVSNKFDSKHRKPSAAFYYLCKIHFLLYSCCLHDDCMLLFRKLALALLHLKRWPTSPRHPQRFTTSGIRGRKKVARDLKRASCSWFNWGRTAIICKFEMPPSHAAERVWITTTHKRTYCTIGVQWINL